MLLLALIGAAAAGDLAAGASVEANLRLGTTGCADPGSCPWLDFHDAAVFSPWAEASPDSRVKARAAVDLRLHGPTALAALEDSGDSHAVQPWSARIRDAWVSSQWGHLGLTLGAQRVAWGVATGISVVDNVNPYDLEDPTRFDRRLATALALGRATSGHWELQAIYAPFFVPALLPADEVDLTDGAEDLFDAQSTGAGDVELGELESRVRTPTEGLGYGAVAARLRWTPPWADLALSWFHGRDTLPQVDGEVVLTGFQTDSNRVDVGIPIAWPRVDVGGVEVRTEVPGEIGAWAEVALVLPEQTDATTSLRQLESLLKLGTIDEVPDPLPQTVTQDGQPYARWIAGVDRFLGPVYLNAQWLHGFPTERQRSDLHDYLLLAVRWTVVPTVRMQVTGASDFRGWLLSGDLALLHVDAAEWSIGGAWIDGPDDSALAGFRRVSHLRTSAKLAF